MRSTRPLTYPIHTTLITGVYPETHGIIHNQKASISPTVPDFSLMGSDWYWQKENVKVPTLVDAIFADGRKAASVNWPVTAGDMRGWNLPEIWPVKELGDDPRAVYEKSASRNVFDRYYDAYVGHYNWKNNDDLLTYGGEIAIDIIEKEKPDLMLYHAVHLDHIRHKYGDMAEETVDCLKTLDILVNRIIEATKRNGTYEDTNFVILGDHGQIDIDAVFYINNALRDAGLIQVDENGTPVAYDAYAFSAGFSAHVYLRDPSDPELVKKVDAILHGLQKAFPQYIERVYTKEEATHLEHLTGAFSFVLEGTFGTILQTRCQQRALRPAFLRPELQGIRRDARPPSRQGAEAALYRLWARCQEGRPAGRRLDARPLPDDGEAGGRPDGRDGREAPAVLQRLMGKGSIHGFFQHLPFQRHRRHPRGRRAGDPRPQL